MYPAFIKNIAKMEWLGGRKHAPETRAPIFTGPQKITAICLCVLSGIAPHYLPIDVLSIGEHLMTISIITLAFTMSSVAFLIKKVEDINEKGRGSLTFGLMFKDDIDFYGTLTGNAKLAMSFLFLNFLLGMILVLFNIEKIEEALDCFSLNLLESFVLVMITATIFFTASIISRIFEVISDVDVND